MTKPKIWKWSPKKYELARYLSEGDTYKEAADKIGRSEAMVQTYMNQVPEFRQYVDKITIENEMASRAGIIRRAMNVAKKKLPNAEGDKDTYLDYLKFLRDQQKGEEVPDTELTVTFK